MKKKKKKRSHGKDLPSSSPNQTSASHLLRDKAVRTNVCIVANCFRVIPFCNTPWECDLNGEADLESLDLHVRKGQDEG